MKKNIFPVLLAVALILLIIIYPDHCATGALKGLVICGNVIIPSLYPFSVCVLIIMRSGILNVQSKVDRILFKFTGQTGEMLFCMILSFIGGYPIGSRLILELYEKNKINQKQANLMLLYCVNAGPAFIVLVVGNGILNSKKCGYILLASHILSSLIISLFLRRSLKKESYIQTQQKYNNSYENGFADIFVTSASDSATSLIGICSYIIFFSTLNGYISYISEKLPFLKYSVYLTEVTCALSNTRNIYLIAFLLGFSGLCIWCQVYSGSKSFKMNIKLFALSRILHGVLSTLITFIQMIVFRPKIKTIGNLQNFTSGSYISDISLCISLVIMAIVMIISIENKNFYGNLKKDLLQ